MTNQTNPKFYYLINSKYNVSEISGINAAKFAKYIAFIDIGRIGNKVKIEDVMYTAYSIDPNSWKWSADDSIIFSIEKYHKGIVAKFKKIAFWEKFEIWENINIFNIND